MVTRLQDRSSFTQTGNMQPVKLKEEQGIK